MTQAARCICLIGASLCEASRPCAAGRLRAASRRPLSVTAVLYLSPPVTMIWAWVMFGEPLSWAMAGGLAVSLLGIVVFARSRRA